MPGATAEHEAVAVLGAEALGAAALGAVALVVAALGAAVLGAAVLGAVALDIRSCGAQEDEGIWASFSQIPTQSATSSACYVYTQRSCNHQAYREGIVVRARQELEQAPCIENSFSQKRQHDDVVVAADSLVVIKQLATVRCAPPITPKLDEAIKSALTFLTSPWPQGPSKKMGA